MRALLAPAVLSTLTLIPAAAMAQSVEGSVQVTPPQITAPAPAPVYQQPAPQTVYVQQQPAYPPPAYGYAPPPAYGYGRLRRRAVPYSGGPIPQNAHLEERPNTGLIVAGSIIFGLSYVPSLFIGIMCTGTFCNGGRSGLGWLALPIAGPLIALGYPQAEEGYRLLVVDSIFQAAGFGMLVAGIVARSRVLVYDEYASRDRQRRPQWAVTPGAPGATTGLSLSFTHF